MIAAIRPPNERLNARSRVNNEGRVNDNLKVIRIILVEHNYIGGRQLENQVLLDSRVNDCLLNCNRTIVED